MTAPTHKQYAVSFACITAMLLYAKDITEINYYISLPILLMTSKSGALFPDVDHSWQNVKEKTVINKIINTIIHITKGKHRSWQTHSIDIMLWFTSLSYILPQYLYKTNKISLVNKEVLLLLLLGFSSGWISHLFSDMLTHAGVRLLFFIPKKVAVVPKSIGGLKFNTGNVWEAFCYKQTKIVNVFLGIVGLLYPLILSGKLQELFLYY